MNTIFKPHDEWEPYIDIDQHGKLTLSNIEFTTTNLCNMRCSHCAVGYTLLTKELPAIPADEIIRKLDEVETLRTMSFTGGEPLLTKKGIKDNLLPLLKYAKSRGLRLKLTPTSLYRCPITNWLHLIWMLCIFPTTGAMKKNLLKQDSR